jgi:hypothetical protein
LLREHLRTSLLKSIPDVDLVIRVSPSAYATAAPTLRRELSELSVRLGELEEL